MYRIFAMSESCLLFQLGSGGWVVTNGTNHETVTFCRKLLDQHIIPALPNGEIAVDAYIARVDTEGRILETYNYSATRSESEG
jgi:hypothetical protein